MNTTNPKGAQGLTLEQRQPWKALRFGMFIRVGMSTFDGNGLARSDLHSTACAPDKPAL